MNFDLCAMQRRRHLSKEFAMSRLSVCLLVVLLCLKELSCTLQWRLPYQERPPQAPGQGRKNVMKPTLYKTSRAALYRGLQWSTWRRVHNKSYSTPSEALEKYVVWRSNAAYIDYHNSYAEVLGFTLAMNRFGDMVSVCSIQKIISNQYFMYNG